MIYRPVALLLMCLCLAVPALAQVMRGEVVDVANSGRMANVAVQNVHSGLGMMTEADGIFNMNVKPGELVEFRKLGYKTLRVRVPAGNLPPFFKVVMQEGPIELPGYTVNGVPTDRRADSAKYYELYRRELEFPRLKGYQVIQHPFSALSKRNRQIWAFQKEYTFYQQQKYIDFAFNPQLITRITGITGDSLQTYIQMFRPTFEQLESMSEYNFYGYIKRTVTLYRQRGIRARMVPGRNAQ